MNHASRGCSRIAGLARLFLAASASVAQAAQTPPPPQYEFQDGVVVALQGAAGAQRVFKAGTPTAATVFQGIGTNLGQLADIGFIPCSTGSAATGCTFVPPGPTISAKSVRASINLPFGAGGAWQLVGTQCRKASVQALGVDSGNAATTMGFFDAYGATTFYPDNHCGAGPDAGAGASMQDRFGTSSPTDCRPANARFKAACFMDGTHERNLDWLEVFFASPREFLSPCAGGQDVTLCAALDDDPATMANFATYKAAQLVYQGRFGAHPQAPRYIELFNEPEGTWNVKVTPAQFEGFVGTFLSELSLLVQQRRGEGVQAPESTYLTNLLAAKVVAPALGSAYLLDYDGDTAPWDTSADWFDSLGDMTGFYATLGRYGALVSTHMYDDKRIGNPAMPGLDVTTGLDQLFTARAQAQSNAAVVISEAATTVQADAVATSTDPDVGYNGFCHANQPRDGSSTEGACDGMLGGDPPSVGFSYPDCIAGGQYVSDGTGTYRGPYAGTPIADFCHHQAAKLYRNLANYANRNDRGARGANGVVSEMIWVSTPSQTSTEHGLVSRQGVATLMNLGTEPLLANFAIDGYTTVFPLTLQQAPDDDLGAGLFAPSGAPQVARLALANTSSATRIVTVNFGSTPIAQFTTVSTGSSFGGTRDRYTGRLEAMAKGASLHAPAGSTFASAGSRLVVTLPANSAVTLDLAP